MLLPTYLYWYLKVLPSMYDKYRLVPSTRHAQALSNAMYDLRRHITRYLSFWETNMTDSEGMSHSGGGRAGGGSNRKLREQYLQQEPKFHVDFLNFLNGGKNGRVFGDGYRLGLRKRSHIKAILEEMEALGYDKPLDMLVPMMVDPIYKKNQEPYFIYGFDPNADFVRHAWHMDETLKKWPKRPKKLTPEVSKDVNIGGPRPFSQLFRETVDDCFACNEEQKEVVSARFSAKTGQYLEWYTVDELIDSGDVILGKLGESIYKHCRKNRWTPVGRIADTQLIEHAVVKHWTSMKPKTDKSKAEWRMSQSCWDKGGLKTLHPDNVAVAEREEYVPEYLKLGTEDDPAMPEVDQMRDSNNAAVPAMARAGIALHDKLVAGGAAVAGAVALGAEKIKSKNSAAMPSGSVAPDPEPSSSTPTPDTDAPVATMQLDDTPKAEEKPATPTPQTASYDGFDCVVIPTAEELEAQEQAATGNSGDAPTYTPGVGAKQMNLDFSSSHKEEGDKPTTSEPEKKEKSTPASPGTIGALNLQ